MTELGPITEAEKLREERDELRRALEYIDETFIPRGDGTYRTYSGPRVSLETIHAAARRALGRPHP